MENRINTDYAAETGYEGVQNPSVGGSEKADGSFADKMAEKYAASPQDMSLAEYKLYFHDKIKAMYTHPSQKRINWFIDITNAAYRRMQADPAYERQVLDFLARQKAVNYGGHVPAFALIHIDDTWDKCYGYTYGIRQDERTRRAAERRRLAAEQAKKARRKKLLKEYLKKRAEAKRLQDKLLNQQISKRYLEHLRLTKEWNDKAQLSQLLRQQTAAKKQRREQAIREWSERRQAAQALNAYEASIIMLCRQERQQAKADIFSL